jgi:GT2 family glycosyltransferase
MPILDSSGDSVDISIVIVSFNTRNVLRECLQSIERESAGLRIEILVVDNHSSDGSPEMVEKEFPQVRLFRCGVNLGFASANNVALEVARGRYSVLLNSDAFLCPNALTLAVQHMDQRPSVGLAGARLVGRDNSWQPSARMFPSLLTDFFVLTGLASKFPKSHLFGSFDRTWADPMLPAQTDWVPGAFSIIRTEALTKVGPFDPEFFLYSEEVDLCRRIRNAGFEIWYWPDIVVIHIGGESSRQVNSLEMSSAGAQLVLWRMRSTLLYYRKHHGSSAWGAKLLELGLYHLTLLRNRFSSNPRRQGRTREYRNLIALMKQAWKDTHGGRISPPRPW